MNRPQARRARRGAAAIEFVLSLVLVLLPLLAAVLEWSWYFYQEIRVMRIARDAVRVGVSDQVANANRDDAASDWALVRLAEMGMSTESGVVTVTSGATSINVGTETRPLLQITMNVPYTGVFGLLPEPADPPDTLHFVYGMVSP